MADYPNAKLNNAEEYIDQVASQFDLCSTCSPGMLAMAIVIALLGIANTLALSIMERKREIGLLRAVGMTRRQVRRMIRWEAVLIAVFGAVIGMIVGVGLGVAVVAAIGSGITAGPALGEPGHLPGARRPRRRAWPRSFPAGGARASTCSTPSPTSDRSGRVACPGPALAGACAQSPQP